MAEAIVSIVVERLSNLLIEESELLHVARDQIEELVLKLRWMNSFLPDADSKITVNKIGVLVADIQELTYNAEHVVERFLLKASSRERHRREGGIKNILNRHFSYQKNFNREVKDVLNRVSYLSNVFREYNIKSTLEGPESSTSGTPRRFRSHPVTEPELFVGFHRDVETLVRHLVNETDDCYRVISICGMGGLGKTTLAEKIYNHCTVKNHFSGLAWVTISQKWQAKALLQGILISLVPEQEKREEFLKMENTELQENLVKIQQSSKCLIVLDNIWSNEAWDCLKPAFPTENSQSKLLLTSRNLEVSKYVHPNCFIYQPELLNAEQSWELLRLKALPKGDFSENRYIEKMEELGRKMVGGCAGLPLAIVVLGGMLVTKPSLTEWENVNNDIEYSLKRGTGLGEDHQREVFDLLVRSYNDLPPPLRLCFLYLGKIGEDADIEAETLYQLWIAEGMVLSSDRNGEETMMEVAESYLRELVHKSMVQVTFEEEEFSLGGMFKSSRLHDLMRDLSLSKAKEEGFFEVFDLQKGINVYHHNPYIDSSPHFRRLAVYSDRRTSATTVIPFPVRKANQRHLRSILKLDEVKQSWLLPKLKLRWNGEDFRLLRVCSLNSVEISNRMGLHLVSNFTQVLSKLVYLRYLSLRNTDISVFPSFIQNLELLQTFKLETKGTMSFPASISKDIMGKLGRLRHLYLPTEVSPLKKNCKLRFDGLRKLEILENFNTEWCEVKDLLKLTNLRRLTIYVGDSYEEVEGILKYIEGIWSASTGDKSSSSSYSGNMSLDIRHCDLAVGNGPDVVRQLLFDHRLNFHPLIISGCIPELHPLFEQQHGNNKNNVCSSITSLRLKYSFLKEDPMPVLGKIPTLLNLELEYYAFLGKEMICLATGFPHLQRLSLGYIWNLEKWTVEKGSMPNLSYLSITSCYRLEKIPVGLKFLCVLQKLLLISVSTDLHDRVGVVNGVQGPDFHIVSHVPSLVMSNPPPQHAERYAEIRLHESVIYAAHMFKNADRLIKIN